MVGYVSNKALGSVDKKLAKLDKKQHDHEEKDDERFRKISDKKKKKKKKPIKRDEILHV